MNARMFVTAAVAAASIAAADAQTYRVEYRGTAATPTGIINGVNPSPVTSSIKAGDAFNVMVEYDISKARVSSFYDADPKINIYDLPMTYSYTVGGYSSGVQTYAGSIQIWDGYKVSDSLINVDSYSIGSLFRYLPTGDSPVELGAGQIAANMSLYAFDFTGSKLDNDFIRGLPNFDGWNVSMTLGFLNTVTNDFGYINANNVTATISQISAVPETETWMMLIFGMGMIGFAMRRKLAPIAAAA